MFDYLNRDLEFDEKIVFEPLEKNGIKYIKYLESPYLSITTNWSTYLNSKSKKSIYNINRSIKYLSSFHDLRFIYDDDKNFIRENINAVIEIHRKRWLGKLTLSKFSKKNYKDEYINFAINSDKKNFVLSLLILDGKIISYIYCLRKNKTIYVYSHAIYKDPKFEKKSVGKVHFYFFLKRIYEQEEEKKIDFMLGDEKYKFEWCNNFNNTYLVISRYKGENIIQFIIRYYVILLMIKIKKNKCFKILIQKIYGFIYKIYCR